MRPESVAWTLERGVRVALLCGQTAQLTDQQLLKRLGSLGVQKHPETTCFFLGAGGISSNYFFGFPKSLQN